ncbi:MAG: enoyl-CoA hydratase/isomerase family protein [Desulfobacter sp.]|nr:MAG: enoyl-CoA hydratase/isomerase family protein [Desulfobacter sp.]
MEETRLKIELKDRICILTLNDPGHLNAMSEEMSQVFRDTITDLGEDGTVKVLILTGAGRAFSAGGNLDDIAGNYKGDPAALKKASVEFYSRFLCIRNLKVPTIAAVNGHAVGAGACLALACDMRMAGESARFGFPFARLGLHPGMGAEYLLHRIVGEAKTFELLMTGALVESQEAMDMGMVNHVVADEELMDKTMDLARRIAAMPDLPLKMMKETIPAARTATLDECLHRQAAYQAINYMTEDFKEGIDALKARRAPKFRDRY